MSPADLVYVYPVLEAAQGSLTEVGEGELLSCHELPHDVGDEYLTALCVRGTTGSIGHGSSGARHGGAVSPPLCSVGLLLVLVLITRLRFKRFDGLSPGRVKLLVHLGLHFFIAGRRDDEVI